MNILVTGGAGFIGSNFIKYMLSKYNYTVINLDLLTYAGNLENFRGIELSERYHFVQGDICDRELLKELFKQYDIQSVIHFAAESHVDRSIEDPEIFLKSNVLGTQALLDTAKEYWKANKADKYCTTYKDDVKFIHISTDEVYGSLGKTGNFTEDTKLAPNSPYSASKAASDMIVRAYYETYKLPVVITRCSNNYGSYQYPEKLIPLMIHNALNELPLPVYGDGKQVRDWLHVEDHCSAIDTVLHSGIVGEIYNIGGNNEKENIEIVKFILKSLNKSEDLIEFVQDRLGHDRRYAISNLKIMRELGWSPMLSLDEGLTKTIQWYKDNKAWMNIKKESSTKI
ncbi:dTDP-glucose 4,6-dehydratase [Psychrobacillus sp. NEAU-3TGS]|uniref:dTDP-glucose 4,6-dehydratase n=1 Tax=Psychrobacillus sp. NEAU-3TGS TaxID=2995412 RepID=UPI00249917C0|nr:dTDP-glucose 4,6-dehydratase [Psychrobacillus sp. NEAU-3TGS]MDI2586527.1 dTDP-glucose 4,6-dehydratase [Psychrobacillus sp. NEAU-3TGS]